MTRRGTRDLRRKRLAGVELEARALREVLADALDVVDHGGNLSYQRDDVALPRDARRIETRRAGRVEAARRLASELAQVGVRGGDQARALGRRDARGRAAEVGARAQAHLDEHQRVAVARDEVDLAATRAEVAVDDDEAAACEIVGGDRLGARAAGSRGGVASARAIERHEVAVAEHREAALARELPAVDERDLAGGALEREALGSARRETPARRETRRGRAHRGG